MSYRTYDLNNDIKYFRDLLGISQEEFGKILGVSRNTVCSIETGKTIPNLYLAFLIADSLQIPLERLFYYEYEGVKCTPFSFRFTNIYELREEKKRELGLFNDELPFT